MDASGDANDWEKQIEQMKKDMEEWKAKEAHVPKPNPEPKPHTELPQEDKDRIEEAQISDEAAKVIKYSKSTSWYPENREHVVAKLNKGLYHRLLMRFEVSVGVAGHPR
ncbi:MAG: hypothetical protein LQ349_000755 [Xanthoria aureola]|nr:MAG: hypothetical protein LQ349_000755 [Xanthoria aureola]